MRIKDVGAGSAQLVSQLITVKLLGDNADLMLSLARFDAAKAQCRYDRDRQKLLAMIEASFGTQYGRAIQPARARGAQRASPRPQGSLAAQGLHWPDVYRHGCGGGVAMGVAMGVAYTL